MNRVLSLHTKKDILPISFSLFINCLQSVWHWARAIGEMETHNPWAVALVRDANLYISRWLWASHFTFHKPQLSHLWNGENTVNLIQLFKWFINPIEVKEPVRPLPGSPGNRDYRGHSVFTVMPVTWNSKCTQQPMWPIKHEASEL